ncbi:hypothetical protein HGM15179_007227 [Zosterops borbonicus]|uniref:Cytoplasmic phosphatidylinositol transfer protein 1 n=3 Tax=Passeriformes TaxID=9126 RepID=A0A8K1GLZ0_9PASS|nr:hypothetical protein HGM15179_007227 [Zosterops borbonicus]
MSLLDQAAQGPIQAGFEGGYFYWAGVRSIATGSHLLQKARSCGVPAGELSSSGAFCSLQHLPNGRHHAELPGTPSVRSWYRIGQLYMISKHSHEQSDRGEGVEVVQNEPYEDPNHGNGQLTEKRVYLNSKLPSWARAVVPKIFYVTEKAWNYYPYTITGKECGRNDYCFCSFLPKFSIHIETKYEDNKGSNDSIFDKEAKDLEREVCFIDIASDEIPERYYKESEDPKYFKSQKTGRGQLKEGWRETHQPIMCSYKLVTVKFEVWGLQTRVEQFVHKVVRDILLIGHRQAFAWVDEWYDMTMDEVREFERATQEATNKKIGIFPPAISISNISMPSSTRSAPSSAPSTPLSTDAPDFLTVPKDRPRKKSAPETLTLPDPSKKTPLN